MHSKLTEKIDPLLLKFGIKLIFTWLLYTASLFLKYLEKKKASQYPFFFQILKFSCVSYFLSPFPFASPLSQSSAEPVFLVKLEGRPPVSSTEGSVTQPERSCIHMEWRVLIFQSHNRVNTALPFNKHHWQASMYCHWNDWTQLKGEGGGGGGVNVFFFNL